MSRCTMAALPVLTITLLLGSAFDARVVSATEGYGYDYQYFQAGSNKFLTIGGIYSGVVDLCKHPTDSTRFFAVRYAGLTEMQLDVNGTINELELAAHGKSDT